MAEDTKRKRLPTTRKAVLVCESKEVQSSNGFPFRVMTGYEKMPVATITLPNFTRITFYCCIKEGIDDERALELLSSHLIEQQPEFNDLSMRVTNLAPGDKFSEEDAIYVTEDGCCDEEQYDLEFKRAL